MSGGGGIRARVRRRRERRRPDRRRRAHRAAARRAPADGRRRARRRGPRAGGGAGRRRGRGARGHRRPAPRRGGRGRRRPSRSTSARSRCCAATSATASRDRPAPVPAEVAAEAPIVTGDELLGAVLLVRGAAELAADAAEFLHLAAVACLTEVAVEEAREEVEQNLRGSFLEDLRSRPDLDPREVVRRAGRLGCDLSRGAVVLCAELHTDRPRHVVATIAGEHPGALAQHMDGGTGLARLRAAAGRRRRRRARADAARGRAASPSACSRHGTVGLSSFYVDPAELGRAIQEAELVLDVLRHCDAHRQGRARGHRHRHLPAAVPRARLASRGGALLLRGHRRAARALRRPVPHRSRRARSRPTSSRTAT